MDFQRLLQDMSHELHTSIMECQKQWHFQVNAYYAAFHDELILQDLQDQVPKINICDFDITFLMQFYDKTLTHSSIVNR